MEEEQKKVFRIKPYLIAGGIAFAIGAIIFCLFFFIKGPRIASALDGCGYSAIALLGVGGLMYVANNGFFDVFAYGFKQLGSQLFSKEPSKYNDFPGYKEEQKFLRQKKSKPYISILIIGALFLIATIVLLLIIEKNL